MPFLESAREPMRMTNSARENTAGARAEQVAEWYFRLNGFFGIPSFIIHPDRTSRRPRTEADYLGVRFGCSQEILDNKTMVDDPVLLDRSLSTNEPVPLFVIAEVTMRPCKINGPYTDREKGNIDRVLRRLGCAFPNQVSDVADSLYKSGRWESDYEAIQMVAIGVEESKTLANALPAVLQITWNHIATFFYQRFLAFPQKLPTPEVAVHAQWPDFGKEFGEWFRSEGFALKEDASRQAIQRYFESGSCAAPSNR